MARILTFVLLFIFAGSAIPAMFLGFQLAQVSLYLIPLPTVLCILSACICLYIIEENLV